MLLLCNYYLTYKCNAFCEFCHFGDHNMFKDTPFAKLEDFKSNVKQLVEMGVKFIDLTGGEPLLHKEIHLMAEYAKSFNMQTSITTNGLLYHKFAEKLAGIINLLHFSLDSPDEEEHNRIRKVDCYKSVFESIACYYLSYGSYFSDNANHFFLNSCLFVQSDLFLLWRCPFESDP